MPHVTGQFVRVLSCRTATTSSPGTRRLARTTQRWLSWRTWTASTASGDGRDVCVCECVCMGWVAVLISEAWRGSWVWARGAFDTRRASDGVCEVLGEEVVVRVCVAVRVGCGASGRWARNRVHARIVGA